MPKQERMSDDEFEQMITLLSKFVETEMDQFELWKFQSSFGETFVNISAYPEGDASAYTDVTKAIKGPSE